ncbi:uncharacterized protein LOC114187645 isoform X2 [Vigna unguiculata]|uniref:uncharacterized protein LOC114187645 isoform X2 n=1 Tax=Vigna unguiculata TaxID=3917 RepID=UPI001016B6BD|nr:uncharacterized protein LOC114187645 isoform X2 [Vigna unguiculata]XP_027931747.1 uncharacterized protein LOC114187645 isoform X2 [Vigna unguiculata]
MPVARHRRGPNNVHTFYKLPPTRGYTPFNIQRNSRFASLRLASRELGDAKEATIPIEFSEINKLHFEELPNLRGFSCGDMVEWPILKHVILNNSPNLKKFGLGTIKESQLKRFILEEEEQIDIDIKILHLFELSLSLETLKMLYMKNQNFEKLWQNNCHSKSFYELEYLTLSSNKKLLNVISSNIIIRLNKLKKLTLEQCEVLTEIFYLEDDKPTGNIQELLPQLQELALSYLRSFTCIWNMEPSVSFFPNLLSLHIVHCGTLQSLFSISSTKNLQNLKSLKLCNCDKLEEVISIDNREDMTVSFPKMECLVLKDLPKLLSFHQQNGTIHLPNIQIMRARNIPSMKFFSVGIVITPLLRSIHVTFARKLWLGNLNETLSYISNNPGKFHFAKLFGFPS